MAKEVIFKGYPCRFYIKGSIWISSDGEHAFANIKGKISQLKINWKSGEKYVVHPWKWTIKIAEAVITCYCPPPPKDGKKHIINYKDGNKMNCEKSNLEWIEYHYHHNPDNSAYVNVGKNTILTIYRDGTIMSGKDKLTCCKSVFDSDTDLEVVINPHVYTNADRIFIDELMDKAGYIQGDNANLISPQILHLDNNWLNFDSSNLEWVEESDQRYIQYLEAKYQDMDNLMIEYNRKNSNKSVPEFMLKSKKKSI